ncbi:MAG: hypothetical protein LBI28_09390 [Treponema sp.]|nr:hypothetical protein [Treponema sp.]
MRNVFLTFIIIVICGCASIGGTANNAPESASRHSLDYLISGEYAFYLDTRGGMNYYRGYMYFNSAEGTDVIFARNVDINTGLEERFIFSVDYDEDGHPSGVSNVQGQIFTVEGRQAIPDFLNFTTLFLSTCDDYQLQSNVRDEWDDYTLVFSFNKALPFFGFYDIRMEGDNKSYYTLLHAGLLNANSASSFYEINPASSRTETTERRQIPEIPRKNEKAVEQNGVRLTLDENWLFNNNPSLPGFWLSLASIRDSQIAIEKTTFREINSVTRGLNLSRENSFKLFKLTILSMRNNIEMNAVNISQTSNGYQAEFYFNERNFRNYMKLIQVVNGNDFYIINFSSFADIYDNNKDYYQRILNSVVVNRR